MCSSDLENDEFFFTLAPDDAVRVLIVQPAQPRANETLYMRRALEIGDHPRFRVDVRGVDSLTPRDFANRGLVVLDDVAPPGGELGAALRDQVRDGTGLVFAPGDVPWDRVPKEWTPVLRLAAGEVLDRTPAGGARIARVSYSSPVFEPFAAPGSGDFASARLFRHRLLRVAGDSGVLAWFDDATPALVERGYGRGHVLTWASTLDDYWTDLPTQPVFLPFMRQLATHAGRYSDSRPWFSVGTVLDLSRHGELTAALPAPAGQRTATTYVLATPSGKRTRLGDSTRAVALVERGFHELTTPTSAEGSGRPIAVNVDPAESDLAHVDPAEVIAAATARSGAASAAVADGATPEDRERGQRVWWYLLVGAVVVLAAETVLGNRLSGTVTT